VTPQQAQYRQWDARYPDKRCATSGGSSSRSDSYTGCRAYGPNGTSTDDQGRPYTKIDCTTKKPLHRRTGHLDTSLAEPEPKEKSTSSRLGAGLLRPARHGQWSDRGVHGRLEHLCGSAFGFRNLTNYIAAGRTAVPAPLGSSRSVAPR
jgi:hypothetical protein